MTSNAKVGLGILVAGLAVVGLGLALLMRNFIDGIYAETGELWAPGPLLIIPLAGAVIALGSLLFLPRADAHATRDPRKMRRRAPGL